MWEKWNGDQQLVQNFMILAKWHKLLHKLKYWFCIASREMKIVELWLQGTQGIIIWSNPGQTCTVKPIQAFNFTLVIFSLNVFKELFKSHHSCKIIGWSVHRCADPGSTVITSHLITSWAGTHYCVSWLLCTIYRGSYSKVIVVILWITAAFLLTLQHEMKEIDIVRQN